MSEHDQRPGPDTRGASGMGFFTLEQGPDGDLLVPTEVAVSSWGTDQLHGLAVSGALARGIEHAVHDHGRQDLRPTRVTVDLFSPTRRAPCEVETTVVRSGNRICLIDALLRQGDKVTARASGLFLAPSESPGGIVWGPTERSLPSVESIPETDGPRVPFIRSTGEWTQDFSEHQVTAQHAVWQSPVPVVAGEELSRFVHVTAAADSTSMITNWGDRGVEFINSDVTLTLARLPTGNEVGFSTVDRVEYDGISVGTATVFDREGVVGTAVVTALANSRRTVGWSR